MKNTKFEVKSTKRDPPNNLFIYRKDLTEKLLKNGGRMSRERRETVKHMLVECVEIGEREERPDEILNEDGRTKPISKIY